MDSYHVFCRFKFRQQGEQTEWQYNLGALMLPCDDKQFPNAMADAMIVLQNTGTGLTGSI